MQYQSVSGKVIGPTNIQELARLIKLLPSLTTSQLINHLSHIPLQIMASHKILKSFLVKIINMSVRMSGGLKLERCNEGFVHYIFRLSKLQIQSPFRKKLLYFLHSQPKSFTQLEFTNQYRTQQSQNSPLLEYVSWKLNEQNKIRQLAQRNNTQTITRLQNKLHQTQYCLKCNKNLIENKKNINTDQKYSWLFGNHDDRYFQYLIKVKACGLLNSRGGYLLIQFDHQYQGENSPNKQSCDQIKRIIKRYIFPTPLEIEPFQVRELNTQKAIIMVKLLPKVHDLAYYVVKKWDDPHSSRPKSSMDKFVLLNEKNKGRLDDFIQCSSPEDVYTFLIKKFYFLKKDESTFPIKSPQQSRTECINIDHQTFFQSEYDWVKQDKFMQIVNEYPRIYKNNYLFILKNFDILVDLVSEYLKKQKFDFKFMKPFQLYHSNFFKSVWLLGITEIEEATMKETIRQVAAYRKNGGSNNKYTIVKCTKLIKVQNVSQDCKDIEQYMRIFTQKYKKKVNFIKNNKNHKQYISYNYSFSFDTMEESIFFSYLLLENYEKKMKFEEEIRELV